MSLSKKYIYLRFKIINIENQSLYVFFIIIILAKNQIFQII